MRNKIKRLEQAMREEHRMEDSKAEFLDDLEDLKRLAETGEPSTRHRIVGHDGNEVAGPIPDLSE
jgi:hypothetical protein